MYLSNEKCFLIVTDSEMEGGLVIPLESNSLLEYLKHITKDVKFWCGDNYILENFTPQVFTPSYQACQSNV